MAADLGLVDDAHRWGFTACSRWSTCAFDVVGPRLLRGTGGRGNLIVQVLVNLVGVDGEVALDPRPARGYPQGPAERSTAFRGS